VIGMNTGASPSRTALRWKNGEEIAAHFFAKNVVYAAHEGVDTLISEISIALVRVEEVVC
jgi:hypothetical protein